MMNSKECLLKQVPKKEDSNLLLHACCGICSAYPVSFLKDAGYNVIVYFYNPNIFPEKEYRIRKDECSRFAASLGLEIVDEDYNHEIWRERMSGLENEPERGARCLECFKTRLASAAKYAHEHGYKVITTTLASSRWKSLDQINAAGAFAASLYDNVVWWDKNWRKNGLQERRNQLLKEYGFYNQQYCGCEFSMRNI